MSKSKLRLFANQSDPQEKDQVCFVNEFKIASDNWVMLAPYGRFPHSGGMQNVTKDDASSIVKEFKSLANIAQRAMGLPWYIGHPDHPAFSARYTDTKAYGRIKDLEAREDGLYGNVKWNSAGKNLVNEETYHGHSVNWRVRQVAGEFHPVSLKSVGFTNEPNLPVPPITVANEKQTAMKDQLIKFLNLANEATDEQISAALGTYIANCGSKEMANSNVAPPWLCKVMGKESATMDEAEAFFKAKGDASVANETKLTECEKKATDLQKAHDTIGTQLAEANTKVTNLANEVTALKGKVTAGETELANERKLRRGVILDKAITEGRITAADRTTLETEFANSTDLTPLVEKLTKLPVKLNNQSIVNNAGDRNQANLMANEAQSKAIELANEEIKKDANLPWVDAWDRARKANPAVFAALEPKK